MKLVSVFMDVEDPINPMADDAARDVAQAFGTANVRGSFCLTGEKIRTLEARGRADIIDAYRPHCLGLHTNTHSFHPTTMELLADLDYEEGCQAALGAESPGDASFQKAFGRKPAFWGGAGNTWSPEICAALTSLSIPAYSYALTALPNDRVHRYSGCMALPQAFSISESDWADDARAEARVDEVLAQIDDHESPWLGLFVGHPTKLRHRQYWDTPYYAGRTPQTPEFAETTPEADYRRSLTNLTNFLKRLDAAHSIVGVDDVLNLDWQFDTPTADELEFFRRETGKNLRSALGWPLHREGLSAEKIVTKTVALESTLMVGSLRKDPRYR